MGNKEFMRKAIELSVENVKNGGGPFGAVIVKGDEIVATGVNRVTAHNDPTAHAEVSAIREACRRLGTFDLSGCEIYTSCEPCPMCLGAIYWAHLDKIYYGNNKDDAADIGFDDSFIYEELALPRQNRKKAMEELLPEEAIAAFDLWRNTASIISVHCRRSSPSCGKSKVPCNGLWIFHYFYPHKKFPYLFHPIREKMFNFADVM